MKLAGKTDVGSVRPENQDDYRAGELNSDAAWGLVCDGMGGARGGREASVSACDVIEHSFHEQYAQCLPGDEERFLKRALINANRFIFQKASREEELAGWLNPPYSRPLIERFVEKMVRNNNGIALLFNRCDSKMFQDLIFPNASAIMFVKGRIKFYRPDGTQGDSPGCGSVLIAFGEENAKILEYSNIPGKYIKLNN